MSERPVPIDVEREVADLVGSPQEARWILEASGSREGVAEHALSLARRRAAGEPLQHVLGHWAFRTLEVKVDARALIPRPETEVVVGTALAEAGRLAESGPLGPLADLGTGSGVIACALARELPDAVAGFAGVVYATDVSLGALELARENVAAALPPDAPVTVELLAGSWFDPLPASVKGRLDLVVSNPPYLAASELAGLDPVVREYEPEVALIAGASGLECIDEIVSSAPAWLSPRGCLVLEIAPHQREEALRLAATAGFSAEVENDLAGRPRVLVARRS